MHPYSEEQRLQRLQDFAILDTPGDLLYRKFAEQALSAMPGACIAGVSLIDAHRQWFKTVIGLGVKETPREVSFCSHTIETDGVMVVEDATQDGRFAANPFVVASPGIRFYAGVRLIDGIGALCVLGKRPRSVEKSEIANLSKIANYVEIQLLAHGVMSHLKSTSQMRH